MNATQFQSLIIHPDRDVRLRAAMDAATLRESHVTAALVNRLGIEDDFHVREYLTWALVQHGDDATDAVLALLDSENPVERRQAAHVLSKIGDPSHAPHLVDVVADADPDVAVKAYRAAANTGSAEVVGPLVSRLGDGDGGQRDALSNAMQHLGVLGVPALTAALVDPEPSVRLHAAEALAQIGESAEQATPSLARLATDDDTEVAIAAVMALGTIGSDEAYAALATVADGGRQPLAAVARRLLNDRA